MGIAAFACDQCKLRTIMVDSHAKNKRVKFYTSNNNNLLQIEEKIITLHMLYIMSSLKTYEQTVNHFSLVSMLQQRALGNFKRGSND